MAVATYNPPAPTIPAVLDIIAIGKFAPVDLNCCCPVKICGFADGDKRA